MFKLFDRERSKYLHSKKDNDEEYNDYKPIVKLYMELTGKFKKLNKKSCFVLSCDQTESYLPILTSTQLRRRRSNGQSNPEWK